MGIILKRGVVLSTTNEMISNAIFLQDINQLKITSLIVGQQNINSILLLTNLDKQGEEEYL